MRARVCVCLGGMQVRLAFVFINNITSLESVVHSERICLRVDEHDNKEIT